MQASDYGDVWADFLDEWIALTGAVPSVALLERVEALAGPGGRVLELGVGTGFLAVPLTERGLHVHGVDASQAMLDRLPPVVTGHLADAADLPDLGRFDVVLFASSSIFCLPDADAQARCVAGMARHGDIVVIETYEPDPAWFDAGGRMHFVQARGEGWRMRWDAVHHPAAQVIEVVRSFRRDGETDRTFPHRERYVLPDQLDAMATAAGLRRTERTEGERILSVYER